MNSTMACDRDRRGLGGKTLVVFIGINPLDPYFVMRVAMLLAIFWKSARN
jgi:hypothetical protein